MSKVDTCLLWGSVIPEGRQVCPICENEVHKMSGKNSDCYNRGGYTSPPACEASKPTTQVDSASDRKVNFLIKVINFIAARAGFDVTNRIELRNRKTGREYK